MRWRTKDTHYEIVRRKHFVGERYVDRFYSLAVCRSFNGKTIKCFTGKRGTYRTFEAATKAVVIHRRRWKRFIKLGDAKGRRDKRLKELVHKQRDKWHTLIDEGAWAKKLRTQRARVEIENSIFGSPPLWVEAKADKTLLRMQFPDLYKSEE